MNQTSTLKFSATTSIEDIPEADLYAASTYNVNLIPAKSDPANYHHGKFWDIVPNTYTHSCSDYTWRPCYNYSRVSLRFKDLP
jgi:hypothetical protein